MSAQFNRRQKPRLPPLRQDNGNFKTISCGTEKLRLLKAPSVDADAMWKAQAFDFARDQLRGKLSATISADTIISVIGEQFPMPTMAAEQEARRIVSLFRMAFGCVDNLTPTVMLDRGGNDQTGLMYRTPRPANVCYLGVKARIPMQKLSTAFDDSFAYFNLSYYLELPQSFNPNTIIGPASTSSISSISGAKTVASQIGIDNFDANFFSPAKKKRRHEMVPYSVNTHTSHGNNTAEDVSHVVSVQGPGANHTRFDEDGFSVRNADDQEIVQVNGSEENENSQSSWQSEEIIDATLRWRLSFKRERRVSNLTLILCTRAKDRSMCLIVKIRLILKSRIGARYSSLTQALQESPQW